MSAIRSIDVRCQETGWGYDSIAPLVHDLASKGSLCNGRVVQMQDGAKLSITVYQNREYLDIEVNPYFDKAQVPFYKIVE
jgi:hypothetical protein